jgi:hypothetical protein
MRFRSVPIDPPRNPRVSFFSFLCKGLFNDLKPDDGFNKKIENKINNTLLLIEQI